MIFVAFDLETTGLIDLRIDDPNYQPRITELGAVKWGQIDTELSLLVNPEIEISAEITRITGIKNADCLEAPTFLASFYSIAKFFTGVDHLVTFNGKGYDLPVMMYNLRRYGLQYQFPWPRYHTDVMLSANDYLGMQGKTGNKSPKLVELFHHLFNKEFENAHRAINDAQATKDCFQELQRRGVI